MTKGGALKRLIIRQNAKIRGNFVLRYLANRIRGRFLARFDQA